LADLALHIVQLPARPVHTSLHSADAGSWAFSIMARAKAAEAAAMNDADNLAAVRIAQNADKLASLTKGLGLGLEKMNPDFRLEFDKKAAWLIKEQFQAEQAKIAQKEAPQKPKSEEAKAAKPEEKAAQAPAPGVKAPGVHNEQQHVSESHSEKVKNLPRCDALLVCLLIRCTWSTRPYNL
jgi:hypothetical protein